MAEQQTPNKKLPRIKGTNFTIMEVNLISRRVVEELGLLRGKFGPDITADAKNKIWAKITDEVNALGVSYRKLSTVKTKFRNLTRDAKEKFTYERKERNKTGGGPAPKPISMAEKNIINAMKDTSSFKGIDGGMETSVDSITSDQMFTAVTISLVPALNGFPTCQTVDDLPSSVESIWIRRLEQVHQRNEELALSSATVHASLPVPVPAQKQTCTHQPPKPSESMQKKKAKRTADDVYELQCLVLESDLKRNEMQMELFQRQMQFYNMMIQKKTIDSENMILDALLITEA
ncbi:Hypothetical predicted protein [Mytilus galloprovincialis]|uniref:Myb/SANT-like DNA-binding domain-containing protein n=1 Tax=Mytilus galloprovincialis TaxID=29158 RepID=A0A8B6GI16_MYTGA|nr:Hypothetical predicted protein [Mytilus galloprovincialis]